MALAKITGQGLAAIAFLVALLWTCILGERLIVRHANAEAVHALQENRLMQMRRAQPARLPERQMSPARPSVG